MTHDYRAELNDEQYEAVTSIDGPVLIIAGAGSGKTRVITFRMAYMLDKGIPQSQILALTFTNKAAREMAARVKELTGKKLQMLTVSTFHAFGVRVLREDIHRLGWRDNFSIYDDVDRNQLIKDTGRELGFSADALDVYKIGSLFSNIKIGRWTWESANDQYRRLFEEYQAGLKLYNAVDFDDLILLPIKLFREHPEVLAKYRERYKYVMVDEFQDTSVQQYEFMHALADRNVCVVGDDDQSIYSWRGANYENIRMFERDFPGLREIKLEQNYRSTETILAAANGVIAHNTNRKEKALWSGNGSGKPIEIYVPENEADEADFVTEMIQTIRMNEKRSYADFGVLIRANTLSRAVEESFLESNVPYVMSGGTSFFQRKEIKDVISYLRVIANPDDDVNLLRIINTPRRGIGRKTIEDVSAIATAKNCSLWTAINALVAASDSPLAEKTKADLEGFVSFVEDHRSTMLSGKDLSNKVKKMVDEIDYWSYLVQEYQKNEKAARYKFLNIDSLINSISTWEKDPDNFKKSLYDYLNRITLISRDDLEEDEDKGKVNLMTIHASKGLEFPVVFIVGAEDGIIPHARCLEEGDGNVEEERRLFYVAITRARDKLFISSCRRRRKMGGVVDCSPSPFLQEIPASLVEYHEPSQPVEAEGALDILAQMKARFA
ncbi:MAG TPA: 3'-5' exonuclease [Treponemataceae bacterium]|jgi:DNA helicase-2/ATP-dependent DNA helicase PcrA|nr:3'-5' exonuclease [Treponemataceae bacterium]